MADQYKEDKTEKATPKRRNEARNKGNIPQSQEISLVVLVMGVIISLRWLGPYMRNTIMAEFRKIIGLMNDLEPENIPDFALDMVVDLTKILAPILTVILLLSFLSTWAQVGNLWTLKPLKPQLSKIKPKFSELQFFKKDKMVKLGMSVAKLAIILPVAYTTVVGELHNFMILMNKTIPDLFNFICMMVYKVVFRVGMILVILAIIDYLYQRYRHEENLKMTKQEVKDEQKNMDQDPKIKGRIRSMGREIMRQLMYQEVPKADVVITNPTHIAVAIKYDPANMSAPRVVAKGARLIAEKIKKIAKENNVPVVENKPLARILFKTVDIGMEIPPELYKAVAEVLAYVYRINNKRMAGSAR